MCMLQATDYNSLDETSFFADLLDELCWFHKIAFITDKFMKYLKHINFIFPRFSSPRWTEAELRAPEKQIFEFRLARVHCYVNYQASRIKTQKWHALGHDVGAIRVVGGVKYLHAELNESAHKHLKIKYEKTRRPARQVRNSLSHQKRKYNNANECIKCCRRSCSIRAIS